MLLALLLALQDTIPAATYTASQGTITSGGLLTVPLSATGVVTVTVKAAGQTVVVSTPVVQATTVTAGVPYGVYKLLASATATAPFTLSSGFNSPGSIVQQISDARAKGLHLMLAMTGGPHSATKPGCCLATLNGVLQFSLAGWKTTQATFNTATIRDAIAKGVADGTVLGATVMDEPFVHGSGDGNTWGPIGTMTKARVDTLCGIVKGYFPTLAVGVEHQHQLFDPTKSYRTCDFIVDQYNSFMGSITAWRDAGVAMGKRDGHAILFSLNVLDGGIQDKDGTYDCLGTGGKGTYSPNCRMTAAQLKTNGLALIGAGCGLFQWEYRDDYVTNPTNRTSYQAVADSARKVPAKACRRS